MNKVILGIVILAAAYALTVFGYMGEVTVTSCANLAYYLLLVANTYFSLAFTEKAFHIRGRIDGALNVLLTFFYLLIPWFVGDAQAFHIYTAAFFAVAVVKYANWLGDARAAFFLGRKIPINAGGAFLSISVVAFIDAMGRLYDAHGAVSGLVVFGLANIWVLLIDPLYRAE